MNYEVIYPSPPIGGKPLLVHIPHSSTYVPAQYRDALCLDDADLDAEILAMTDRFTDLLFGQARGYGATLFVNRVSRLVMDPERFPDNRDEPMSSKGMGAIYTRTSGGGELRGNSSSDRDRRVIMDDLYWPYANAFRSIVAGQLDQFGECLIIDGHSFPSKALPYEDESLLRPDICFGYEAFHEPNGLVDILQDACRREGLKTARNQPFSGSYAPADYFQKEKRVKSIMIEVNRSLYMDEMNGIKSAHYSQLGEVLERLISASDTWIREIDTW
jgi:N-formylglutamate amidohydrolase